VGLCHAFALGSQFIIASRQLPPPADRAVVNSAGDVAPPQPPVNSGQ